jgi:5,5'-dehydrodivanillate O-demethylase
MENSLDPTHAECLHAYYMNYVWSRRGVAGTLDFRFRNHVKIGFDRFEHGIIKRRVADGYSEADEPWHIGHPIVFPHILRLPKSFQIRVPVDDTHTLHMAYQVYRPGIPVPDQAAVPVYDVPLYEADGSFAIDFSLGQDMMAWVTQGPITQRDREVLGVSDTGIIMYRQLLLEQLGRVERGDDPMEVYRDPAANGTVQLPAETGVSSGPSRVKNPAGAAMITQRDRLNTFEDKFGPLTDYAAGLFRQAEERMARGEPMITAPPAPVYPVGHMEHRGAVLRE